MKRVRWWWGLGAVLVLVFASAGLAAGVIPIPSQDSWYNDGIDALDCEGAVVEVRLYHETEDTDTPHIAVSVALPGEQPFVWAILHTDGNVWGYADSDRDGYAEWRLPWKAFRDKYESNWCNVYDDLRKGK